jgi:hypothetical protein
LQASLLEFLLLAHSSWLPLGSAPPSWLRAGGGV